MNVELLAFCDAATTHGGKLNVLGIYDYVYANAAPARHAATAVAVRVEFSDLEFGQKHIEIRVVDPDGKAIAAAKEFMVDVSSADPTMTTSTMNICMPMQDIPLERFGDYSLQLAIDKRIEAERTLHFKPAPVG